MSSPSHPINKCSTEMYHITGQQLSYTIHNYNIISGAETLCLTDLNYSCLQVRIHKKNLS